MNKASLWYPLKRVVGMNIYLQKEMFMCTELNSIPPQIHVDGRYNEVAWGRPNPMTLFP
jgi:hypothetical protein